VTSTTFDLDVWQFTHPTFLECDHWATYENPWSFAWKLEAPYAHRETVLSRPWGDEEEVHRVDVAGPRGLVRLVGAPPRRKGAGRNSWGEFAVPGDAAEQEEFFKSFGDQYDPPAPFVWLVDMREYAGNVEFTGQRVHFVWKRAFKWVAGVKAPLFLDVGEPPRLFRPMSWSPVRRPGWSSMKGEGIFIDRNYFKLTYLL
jgi:hypothetical protein